MVFVCSRGHAMIDELHHASRAMEWNRSVFNSDEQLNAVLAKLEECRSALTAGGNRETADLVSVAVLDLRMRLNRIRDADLKLLCDEIIANAEDRARQARASEALAFRPLLRVVK
jgi:hypothetical protein